MLPFLFIHPSTCGRMPLIFPGQAELSCGDRVLCSPVGEKTYIDIAFPILNYGKLSARYDLLSCLSCLIVKADCTKNSFIHSFDSFKGKRILILGDSHHGRNPIKSLLEYSISNKFDVLVTDHDRHHLHWFEEVGHSEVFWTPHLLMRPIAFQSCESKTLNVSFVGQIGRYHPYRRKVLASLKEKVDVFSVVAPNAATCCIYNQSLASLNISLNGDLNLRFFEVPQAGSALLTDRLSKQSGQGLLLEKDIHYLEYRNLADLIEKAQFCKRHAAECIAIGSAGQLYFQENFNFQRRIQSFLSILETGKPSGCYDLPREPRAKAMGKFDSPSFWARVRQYEWLQEEHLQGRDYRIGFDKSASLKSACDLVDLPRHQVLVANLEDPMLKAADVLDQVNQLELHDIVDVLFVPAGQLGISHFRCKYLVVNDFEYCSPAERARAESVLELGEFTAVSGQPDIFSQSN